MVARPDINNPKSPTSQFRRRRFRTIEGILERIIAKKGEARVVDLGGRRDYWRLLNPELARRLRVTFINLPSELEVGRQPSDRETLLEVRYIAGDACSMPEIADGTFDLVHSNSVIEHVGSLSNMVRFAAEARRVGVAYYVQTPYLWFPIEPHYGVPFVHWLPAPSRAKILHRFNVGYATRQPDYTKVLTLVDHTQIVDATLMRELFPDGRLVRERVLGLTKSLAMVREPCDSRLR